MKKLARPQPLALSEENPQLEKFYQLIKARIKESAKNRVSHDVPKENRRLDSLARLLCQNSICVAVSYDSEEDALLISSNKIHEKSKAGQLHFKSLELVMSLLADKNKNVGEINLSLAKIIQLNFYQTSRHLACSVMGSDESARQALEEIVVKMLERTFSSGYSLDQWRVSAEFQDLFDDIPKSREKQRFIDKLVEKVYRLTRDHIKLHHYIHTAPTESYAEAIANKKYKILCIDEPDVHAEIRMMSYLRSKNLLEGSYIGISLLCCSHCGLALYSSDGFSRGLHGQSKGQWKISASIKSPEIFKKFVGDEAYAIFQGLNKKEKKAALSFIQSPDSSPYKKEDVRHGRRMAPDTSGSDVGYGLSDDGYLSPEDFEVTLSEIDIVRQLQSYFPEAKQLLDFGLRLDEIITLYQQDINKLECLVNPNTLNLLNEEVIELTDLLHIYDSDKNLFFYLIDPRYLDKIQDYGVDAVIEKYRAQTRADSEIDEYDDSNSFDEALDELDSENDCSFNFDRDSDGNYKGYSDYRNDDQLYEYFSNFSNDEEQESCDPDELRAMKEKRDLPSIEQMISILRLESSKEGIPDSLHRGSTTESLEDEERKGGNLFLQPKRR